MDYSPWGHKELDTTEQLNRTDIYIHIHIYICFPGVSDKKTAWNAGDLGLIPGLGRCPIERNLYPL